MTSTQILELKDLSLGYRKKPVFSHVSLEMGKGTSVSILGENGVGKTLLFNGLLGLIAPLRGQICFFGKDRSDLDPKILFSEVAWVTSQAEDFPPGLTIRTYFRLMEKIFVRWDKRLSESIGEEFKLDFSKDLSMLSLGESSKVRLLRALAQRPALLVLDELSGNLSPSSKVAVWEALINAMSNDGISVVNFSHYEDEAKRMSDRVLLLTAQGLTEYNPEAAHVC